MDFKELILKKRNIKENSINAYLIALKKLNGNKEIENLDFLNDTDAIVEKINNLKIMLTTKRNYYGAILVALGTRDGCENDELMLFYKKNLQILNDEYNNDIDKHVKTESQEKNWMTLEQLNNIRESYKKCIINNEFRNKTELADYEKEFLTNYVIVSLYTLLPPVRIDYSPMEIITDLADEDGIYNYLYIKSRNTKQFILNAYKKKI